MKNKRSGKDYLVYSISLMAAFITLNILDIRFQCPLLLSFLPILGAHALAFAALKVFPHYTFWMPPLTALYLSFWYWLGTYVTPHFMASADKAPDFGSEKSTIALWVVTLLFCGAAGITFAVKKLTDVSRLPAEPSAEAPPNGPAKRPFQVSIAARVTVYGLSAALVVTSALCAYLYREDQVAALQADLASVSDYTVILPNLLGETDDGAPEFRDNDQEENLTVVYEKLAGIPHKELVAATQRMWYGKGDTTIAKVILRHKDSTVDPVRDFTVGDVTLTYSTYRDSTSKTVTVTDAMKQEAVAIMKGEVSPLTETPDRLGWGEYPGTHSAYVTISFSEHESLYWRAYVSFTEAGEWYLSVYTLPEDFVMEGQWGYEMDTVYYPLSDAWRQLSEAPIS